MTVDVDRLRELARAATPGPWYILERDGEHPTIIQTSHITRDVWTIPRTLEDMDYIVAASPQAVQWMLDRIAELEEAAGIERCEICRSTDVTRHDVEGVPFCQKDWDEWQAQEAAGVGAAMGEAGCADCGLRYTDERWFDLVVLPHEEWAKISPTGDENGLLCPTCIWRRLRDSRGGWQFTATKTP